MDLADNIAGSGAGALGAAGARPYAASAEGGVSAGSGAGARAGGFAGGGGVPGAPGVPGGTGGLGAPTSGQDTKAFTRLLDELGRLPGVGPKSAQRIGYHLLEAPAAEVERLAAAMLDVKRLVHVCPVCFSYATGDTCDVCANPERDATTICVVSEAADVGAIERTHSYRGLYHVLGGVLDPLRRKGPDQLHVAELMARLANGEVEEVILAMDATVEGETTATYVSRLIKATGVRVSRLASGLPVGGSLEYADEVTLGRAIEARTLL